MKIHLFFFGLLLANKKRTLILIFRSVGRGFWVKNLAESRVRETRAPFSGLTRLESGAFADALAFERWKFGSNLDTYVTVALLDRLQPRILLDFMGF